MADHLPDCELELPELPCLLPVEPPDCELPELPCLLPVEPPHGALPELPELPCLPIELPDCELELPGLPELPCLPDDHGAGFDALHQTELVTQSPLAGLVDSAQPVPISDLTPTMVPLEQLSF